MSNAKTKSNRIELVPFAAIIAVGVAWLGVTVVVLPESGTLNGWQAAGMAAWTFAGFAANMAIACAALRTPSK